MELAKKALLVVLCGLTAVVVQGVIGEFLMQFSSWAYPGEVTSIGMFGAAIANPLFFGLYFLPFTTWGLYWLSKKVMDARRLEGNEKSNK